MLAHPSVEVLGHRDDVPELMRQSDVFVLPSIEEGFGLVCTEAMASGCVPLVSDACTEVCGTSENALVHHVGDVEALDGAFTALHEDPRCSAAARRLPADGARVDLDQGGGAPGRGLRGGRRRSGPTAR